MVKLKVDNKELDVPPHATVMDACKMAGVEIPHFCYHPKLSIAGNCRMCLVEIEKFPKPVASCAQPVSEGMVIKTQSEMTESARKGVLELLLINHPLDCPVCDQGGECDLQDLTVRYGPGQSAYHFDRRIVSEKNMGPVVGTVMTRCIHCTRCIRFMNEIAGSPEIGGFSRGENMEISTYLEHNLNSELSGNIIDLCPVGALTSIPFKFQGRSWEMERVSSIDITDAVGSNIRLDVRGTNVMRVLPRSNDFINEDWISDKTRFSYDGLKVQRLDTPYIKKDGGFCAVSWDEALELAARKILSIDPFQIAALSGDLVDCESTFLLKTMMRNLGSPHTDCRLNGQPFDHTHRESYLFNTSIAGIEDSDCILLIGTNPRWEAPLINARIYKRYLNGGLRVANIGFSSQLNYPVTELGNQASVLEDILEGNHPFAQIWHNAQKPMLILGQAALCRKDARILMSLAEKLCRKAGARTNKWNGYNVLHTHTGLINALDVGFTPGDKGLSAQEILRATQSNAIKILYLHGVDTIDRSQIGPDTFVIYQGHHGDTGAHAADIILPGAAFHEKTSLYINTEGRVQQANMATPLVGMAKNDCDIITLLSQYVKKPLPYLQRESIILELIQQNPVFESIGQIIPNDIQDITNHHSTILCDKPFEPYISNFYMTDVISKNSSVMAQCSHAFGLNHMGGHNEHT